ncbi:MAG: HAMP domain-containing sensor histidine kinase [Clostridia bacterium]|nr:HAMP domain-containing sensor histidine kinase [Clostridia bacterium]
MFYSTRFGAKILLYILYSLMLSIILFYVLHLWAGRLIDSHFSRTSISEEHTEQEVENFRAYVSDNGLTTQDSEAIQSWINAEKYVLMSIYKNDYLVYSSSAPSFVEFGGYKRATPPWRHLYDVTFADGEAKVDIIWLASSSYYDVADVFCLVVSILCFVVVFLLLIKGRINYINQLANELKILEGGNLDYGINVKGNDEIADLANGIDEMRQSFLERLKSEEEARHANSELITAMSHDLRTPLTILIGFLDVVYYKKHNSEEQLERYIANSREKAYQIKELSDKLFEYFLVFSSPDQEKNLQRFEGNPLVMQLIGEHVLSLNDQGFTVQITSDVPESALEINLIAIRRVFDNLFNNIKKYADPDSPVIISFEKTEAELSVILSNSIRKGQPAVESTGLGLKTCEKIMAQHHGSMGVSKTEKLFSVTIRFPG